METLHNFQREHGFQKHLHLEQPLWRSARGHLTTLWLHNNHHNQKQQPAAAYVTTTLLIKMDDIIAPRKWSQIICIAPGGWLQYKEDKHYLLYTSGWDMDQSTRKYTVNKCFPNV